VGIRLYVRGPHVMQRLVCAKDNIDMLLDCMRKAGLELAE
jgi:hypothetical protein